ncbi:MAG: SelB C-terminal domain-containing protein [Gemmatimonadota bacterium]
MEAGHRTAVALSGEGIDTDVLHRGQALVTLPQWQPSLMLTIHANIVRDSDWTLEQGQRVRVHVGTAEVMARCALLDSDRLEPGEEGWVQLRLETPVLARGRQRLVLRSYSPVTTFAGGEVVEVFPPKRRIRVPVPEARLHREAVLQEVRRMHREEPYRPGAPVEALRALASPAAPRGFTDAVLTASEVQGLLEVRQGHVREPGFTPRFSRSQEDLLDRLREVYGKAGLAPPTLDELPEEARSDPGFLSLVRHLEAEGALVALEPDLLVDAAALRDGIRRVRASLAGLGGLGPADFREALPVSRRYLLPLLRHLDRLGVTRNSGGVRAVQQEEG